MEYVCEVCCRKHWPFGYTGVRPMLDDPPMPIACFSCNRICRPVKTKSGDGHFLSPGILLIEWNGPAMRTVEVSVRLRLPVVKLGDSPNNCLTSATLGQCDFLDFNDRSDDRRASCELFFESLVVSGNTIQRCQACLDAEKPL